MLGGVRWFVGQLPTWGKDWFYERGRLPSMCIGFAILGVCSAIGIFALAIPPAIPFWTAWAIGQVPQVNNLIRAIRAGDWTLWYRPQSHQPRIPLPPADPEHPERLLDHAQDWHDFWKQQAGRYTAIRIADLALFRSNPFLGKGLWKLAQLCDFDITGRRLAWRRLVERHTSVRWFDRWIFERERRPGAVLGWTIFAATVASHFAGLALPALDFWIALQLLGQVPFATQVTRMVIWHQVRLFNRPGATLRRTTVPSRTIDAQRTPPPPRQRHIALEGKRRPGVDIRRRGLWNGDPADRPLRRRGGTGLELV